MDITPFADDLARRIDGAQEEGLLADWLRFAAGDWGEGVFRPRRAPAPAAIDWPQVHPNDALAELDLMVMQQLASCSQALAEGSGSILAVRCNYGVSILPTGFGAELYIMDRAQASLPNCRPLVGGLDAIRALIDAGVPDLDGGQLAQVWACAERFQEVLAGWPELAAHVHCYHPDFQGPMDVCELLWGSDIFVDLYDEPELVHALLELICETYEALMERWQRVVPSRLPAGFSVHWGMVQPGRIMLRDDSAMNLSPAMFADFIAPYDGRLLANCGGGAVHFCGRGDHYIDQLTELPGLHAINMSQPEYNDMEAIFAATLDRGKQILALPESGLTAMTAGGRDGGGLVHSWS